MRSKKNDFKVIKKLNLKRRTSVFLKLKDRIQDTGKLEPVFRKAEFNNPWFTRENIQLAFEGLFNYLNEDKLIPWLEGYPVLATPPKNIGLVMAGNIPLVGIHDVICILLSGHRLIAKLSSQDEVLVRFILDELMDIEPEFAGHVTIAERLKGIDAVIATGSDNTARYFNYYFSKIPHIIRKNRTSIAVLNGKESIGELEALGADIFLYFGLGCRNVSKILVPEGFDIQTLYPVWEKYRHIVDHHKYHNNYHYQRSIMLVNQSAHLDNGFVLLQKNSSLVSPIGVLYYDHYQNIEQLKRLLDQYADKIQCIVTSMDIPGNIKIGKAQMPDIGDFADHVDTMEFLTGLQGRDPLHFSTQPLKDWPEGKLTW